MIKKLLLAMLAANPDLVIAPDFMDVAMIQTLRDLGLPVYQYKTPSCVWKVEQVIEELAVAVGEPERGLPLKQ